MKAPPAGEGGATGGRGGVDVRDVLQKAKQRRGQKCNMDSSVSVLNGSQLSRSVMKWRARINGDTWDLSLGVNVYLNAPAFMLRQHQRALKALFLEAKGVYAYGPENLPSCLLILARWRKMSAGI